MALSALEADGIALKAESERVSRMYETRLTYFYTSQRCARRTKPTVLSALEADSIDDANG